MGRTKPEETFAKLLDNRLRSYLEQEKLGGHRIDFLVQFPQRDVLVDINGDWWHAKPKIIDCDRVKLNRVLAAGFVPFAVFYSRLQKDPLGVVRTVEDLAGGPERLPWWDWNVDIDSLDPANRDRVRLLLERGAA